MEKIVESQYVLWDLLNTLDDKELGLLLQTNSSFRQAASDDSFWKVRSDKFIDPKLIEKYRPTGDQTYREFYLMFRNALRSVNLFTQQESPGQVRSYQPDSSWIIVSPPNGSTLMSIALAEQPYLYVIDETDGITITFHNTLADALVAFILDDGVKAYIEDGHISKRKLMQEMARDHYYRIRSIDYEPDDDGEDEHLVELTTTHTITPAIFMPYRQ